MCSTAELRPEPDDRCPASVGVICFLWVAYIASDHNGIMMGVAFSDSDTTAPADEPPAVIAPENRI